MPQKSLWFSRNAKRTELSFRISKKIQRKVYFGITCIIIPCMQNTYNEHVRCIQYNKKKNNTFSYSAFLWYNSKRWLWMEDTYNMNRRIEIFDSNIRNLDGVPLTL